MTRAREVTGAERKEMRELYAVHRNLSFVAAAFDRAPVTVANHVGHEPRDLKACADERARRLVAAADGPLGRDRAALATSLGFKSPAVLRVELCRARRRLARGRHASL